LAHKIRVEIINLYLNYKKYQVMLKIPCYNVAKSLLFQDYREILSSIEQFPGINEVGLIIDNFEKLTHYTILMDFMNSKRVF